MSKASSREFIRNIILNGSHTDKLALYQFNNSMGIKEIAKRFNFFVIGNFVRYLKHKQAPFHEEMLEHYIKSYLGDEKYLNIGYRGCAKTTLKKLFDVYVLLNDTSVKKKRYIKVLTKDLNNSKQIVTDVYNLIVETAWLYGDVFEKEGKIKREETMGSFTMKDGRKYASGTVGQVQRGQIQDAYRPDWLWVEDVEDSSTIRSMVQTQGIISKIDEAIQGMSDDGTYVVTANYISEEGTVEWFKNKKEIVTQITPIIDKEGISTWDKFTKEKIESIKNDAEDWQGDYLCDPTSGKDKFFDLGVVEKLLGQAKQYTSEVGFVKLWDEYKPHHKYGMGGDTSEGIGEDSNALALYDFSTNTVIGTFHSNEIAPDLFGYEMARIGRTFGCCIVAPERNNTGYATIAALKEDQYPNIYKEVVKDKYTDEQKEKLGWGTDRKTKPTMWFDFRKDFNDGLITIYDVELLEEIKKYTKADFNDRTTGIITRHFDLLTAAVIGWQLRLMAIAIDENESDFEEHNTDF